MSHTSISHLAKNSAMKRSIWHMTHVIWTECVDREWVEFIRYVACDVLV